MENYDAVVVGAGHNGLVAACYLAKAGLKTLVVEAAPVLGGLSRSESVFGLSDASLLSVAAAWSGMLQPDIVADLRLGMAPDLLDPQLVFVGTDGGTHLDFIDPDVTLRFLVESYGLDRASAISESLAAYYGVLLRAADALRTLFRALTVDERIRIQESLPPDVAAFLDSPMTTILREYDLPDHLQCALVQGAISIHNSAPTAPGGGFSLAYMAMAETRGLAGAWGLPKGGMGVISAALADRLLEEGGTILPSALVTKVARGSDARLVVSIEGGQPISCDEVVVATGLDQLPSMLGADDAAEVPRDTPGCSAAIHLELGRHPQVRGDLDRWIGDSVSAARPFFFASGPSSMENLGRAVDSFYNGPLHHSWPLLLSGSLFPTSLHPVVYLYVQFVHQRCSKDEVLTAAISQLDETMFPGIESIVSRSSVMTPRCIESRLRSPGGHPEHFQMSWPALVSNRPSRALAEYRTRIKGVYHGSASSFPGGLVTGIPGRNVAQVVLADRARRQATPSPIAMPLTLTAVMAKDPSSSKLAAAASEIEAEVFYDVFQDTRQELDEAYGPYLDQTVFIVASFSEHVGMMRLCLPGPRIQKSLEDSGLAPFDVPVGAWLAEQHIEPAQILDLMTVAVRREWQGRGVFDSMLLSLAPLARSFGCTHIAAIVDTRVWRYVQRRGIELNRMTDEARPYYGSPSSVPILVPVSLVDQIKRRPDWNRLSTANSGLLGPPPAIRVAAP